MIDNELIADKLHDLAGILNQAQELLNEIRALANVQPASTQEG